MYIICNVYIYIYVYNIYIHIYIFFDLNRFSILGYYSTFRQRNRLGSPPSLPHPSPSYPLFSSKLDDPIDSNERNQCNLFPSWRWKKKNHVRSFRFPILRILQSYYYYSRKIIQLSIAYDNEFFFTIKLLYFPSLLAIFYRENNDAIFRVVLSIFFFSFFYISNR